MLATDGHGDGGGRWGQTTHHRKQCVVHDEVVAARHTWCRAPNLGSSLHHVSVPGSVADTHNSNKIDIKNHTFIATGENILHGSGYIAWAIGLI